MDRRNWPWRKRSSEKILESAESTPCHSITNLEEHALAKASLDDSTFSLLDNRMAHWQQSNEKLQQLNERLSVALLDASAKDELIKQHAKVAEDAVSGWERAEAEALALKQELESVIQQKLATEDRVSHLDAALRECMCQLRHVREEQEERIHHAIMKNTRELEKEHVELEGKLVDMEQKLMDQDAESQVLTKLLQERVATISEIAESRSRAEAEVNVLRVQLESLEKEYDALKLESSVFRNGSDMEKLLCKRLADRQHHEDARKVASLEAECERLRGLSCKKAPGHHAPAYVKVEAGRSRDKTSSNKKIIGKGPSSMREKLVVSGVSSTKEEMPHSRKDVDALLERLIAMEDETGRLKELLSRRDSELQHARLMCARTASKLSSVEEQLEKLTHDQGSMVPKTAGISSLHKHVEAARSSTVSCEPSVASVSEDGYSDTRSDVWASALITELSHFKVRDSSPSQDGALHAQPCPAMELEQSFPLEQVETMNSLEHTLAHKVKELHAANQLCDCVRSKLARAEQEVLVLQAQNAANQRSLQHVQSQLDVIFQAQDDGEDMNMTLDHVREAMGVVLHSRKLSEEEASSGPRTELVRMEEVARETSSGMGPTELMRLEEELRRTQGEKVAMEAHMRMEFKRLEGLEEEMAQLRHEKVDLQHLLELVNEELDRVKTKLSQSEQNESHLHDEITSANSSRQLMEGQLLSLSASKTESESQLRIIIGERNELQSRVEALGRCLLDKNKRVAELEDKWQEFEPDFLKKPDSSCSRCSLVNVDREPASKEQDIEAKLAECQQTILLLGNQLHGFTSSTRNAQVSHDLANCVPKSEEGDSLTSQLTFHHNNSSHGPHKVSQVNLNDTSAVRGGRRRRRARKGQEWDTHQDGHALDKLDSELLSLSMSGRPLGELFGDKTPAHEQYIQALEELTSSSDNDFVVVEPTLPTRISIPASKLKKKKSPMLLRGADMSRSLDDAVSEKQNSALARLFSRARITHS